MESIEGMGKGEIAAAVPLPGGEREGDCCCAEVEEMRTSPLSGWAGAYDALCHFPLLPWKKNVRGRGIYGACPTAAPDQKQVDSGVSHWVKQRDAKKHSFTAIRNKSLLHYDLR